MPALDTRLITKAVVSATSLPVAREFDHTEYRTTAVDLSCEHHRVTSRLKRSGHKRKTRCRGAKQDTKKFGLFQEDQPSNVFDELLSLKTVILSILTAQ